MKANPGGNLAPEDVIGRDVIIARLWRILQRQSAVLTAERRIGKTSIVQKMKQEPLSGIATRYQDLEKIASAFDFARLVLEDVESLLPPKQRAGMKARQLYEHLAGLKVEAAGVGLQLPGVQAPAWQRLLNQALEDLAEHQQKQQQTLVFFWDETPWMLDHIMQRDGADTVMQLLDSLRALRQSHQGLRMVFTGSIGLHHIERKLHEAGYRSKPFNDTYRLDVPPLDEEAAVALGLKLFEGEGISPQKPQETARVLAQEVDGGAFYIQHVVDEMALQGLSTPGDVRRIVSEALCDAQDRWDLSHFNTRIESYYREQATLARGVLDILAAEALNFDDVLNRLQAQSNTFDAEQTRAMLTLLQRDHYLQMDSQGVYDFRFSLIRRWWRLHRGVKVGGKA